MPKNTAALDFNNYSEIGERKEGGLGAVQIIELASGERFARKEPLNIGLADRFAREVKILVKELDHPNVIKVVASNTDRYPYWFIMPELRPWDTIPELINPSAEIIRSVYCNILDGVGHAHEKNVRHRDLKPANILFDSYLNAIVADFGLGVVDDPEYSRYTRSGRSGGSDGYMAPEQKADFKNVDHRADLYSLGKLLMHWISGGTDWTHENYEFRNLGIRDFVRRAIQPNRENRFVNISEMKTEFLKLNFEFTFADSSKMHTMLSTKSIHKTKAFDYLANHASIEHVYEVFQYARFEDYNDLFLSNIDYASKIAKKYSNYIIRGVERTSVDTALEFCIGLSYLPLGIGLINEIVASALIMHTISYSPFKHLELIDKLMDIYYANSHSMRHILMNELRSKNAPIELYEFINNNADRNDGYKALAEQIQKTFSR